MLPGAGLHAGFATFVSPFATTTSCGSFGSCWRRCGAIALPIHLHLHLGPLAIPLATTTRDYIWRRNWCWRRWVKQVEVVQIQTVESVVDVPVVKTVEMPQIQTVERVVDRIVETTTVRGTTVLGPQVRDSVPQVRRSVFRPKKTTTQKSKRDVLV